MIPVRVELGDRSYDVLIGRGARHELPRFVADSVKRVAVVTQARVGVEVQSGKEQRVFLIPPGERAKTLASVEAVCSGFAEWGLTRSDLVVAVGGGVVTDTAGFAAAIYHRGIPVIHVATTLLGQVDAAVGGKTGVNLPEGKNLVGAFWQPAGVLCDTEVLERLPAREVRSGQGEMAKYAFLGVDDLTSLSIEEAIAACVRCKADVVAADEREGDRRALLNYGHTLGHALESAGHYDLRHGEAVAIGLIFAAHLARLLGRVGDTEVDRHHQVIASYGLPQALPTASDHADLLSRMGRDKKASEGLTFVLSGVNGLEVVRDVPTDLVLAALKEVS